MDLTTFLSMRGAPSAADFARRLGVAPSVVSQWRTGARPVPVKSCVAIERITGGLVARRDLRSDWREIWPELCRRTRWVRAATFIYSQAAAQSGTQAITAANRGRRPTATVSKGIFRKRDRRARADSSIELSRAASA
ncbi:YdaS family helix-turn-helix protein [Burkholderia gladioli]|uniref:YdaS family helix-turn-helix protein n=1 Tax=Burkholderia gladioli TaxID=28095 RepID=UPI00163F10FC